MDLTQYEVQLLPIGSIFLDNDFNCRGVIAPLDVAELAEDIRKNGLQYPITVQPREDTLNYDPPALIPEKYDSRIIAGHRRFTALQILQVKQVPCMIKRGLTLQQALIFNLSENVKRKELNIMQEAWAIQKLHAAGVPRETVALEIGKSGGWVQARYYLLDMPEEIQAEAAAGVLNQYQIKQIHGLPDRDAQFAAVKTIKLAREKGEKKPAFVGNRKKSSDLTKKKERKAHEITEMSEIVAGNCGYGLHTRALAWSAGYISTEEIYDDIREFKRDPAKSLFAAAVKFKRQEITAEEFLAFVNADANIKFRPDNLPAEF